MASELSVVLDGDDDENGSRSTGKKPGGGRRRRQHHGPEQPSRMSKHLALGLVLGMETHQRLAEGRNGLHCLIWIKLEPRLKELERDACET